VPVLIAVGTTDEIAGSADALGKSIPGSQVLNIPNRDHMRAVGDKVYRWACWIFSHGESETRSGSPENFRLMGAWSSCNKNALDR